MREHGGFFDGIKTLSPLTKYAKLNILKFLIITNVGDK